MWNKDLLRISISASLHALFCFRSTSLIMFKLVTQPRFKPLKPRVFDSSKSPFIDDCWDSSASPIHRCCWSNPNRLGIDFYCIPILLGKNFKKAGSTFGMAPTKWRWDNSTGGPPFGRVCSPYGYIIQDHPSIDFSFNKSKLCWLHPMVLPLNPYLWWFRLPHHLSRMNSQCLRKVNSKIFDRVSDDKPSTT